VRAGFLREIFGRNSDEAQHHDDITKRARKEPHISIDHPTELSVMMRTETLSGRAFQCAARCIQKSKRKKLDVLT
jgi:hypothetical protein